MFVSGLDRPWSQTPFPLQGFYIRDLDEIKELRMHCAHVYIDVIKGAKPAKADLKVYKGPTGKKGMTPKPGQRRMPSVPVAPLKVKRNAYREQLRPVQKEAKKARELHQQVYKAVGAVIDQIDQGSIPIQETKSAASNMVDSVIRSPDAFTWLTRVREKDEFTYSHSVRSAVWALLFARHIGLAKNDMDILAMGVLLKDIGKTRLPKYLIESTERSPTEENAYEKFVSYGVDILRKMPDVTPRITSVVKTHCERVNGSGFPQQLRGDKIPLLGKIAGIVTFYDETTNPRNQALPLSPSKAVAKLYEMRGVEFQEELVVEFIRAIGLYPTGTLVELSTGEVGVVVEQNFDRRLKPKVMVAIDSAKQPVFERYVLDLASEEKKIQAKIDAGKITAAEVDRVEIIQDLEPGSFDIDIAEIRDDYLATKSSIMSLLKEKLGKA